MRPFLMHNASLKKQTTKNSVRQGCLERVLRGFPVFLTVNVFFWLGLSGAHSAEGRFRDREIHLDLFGLGNFYQEAKGSYADGIIVPLGGSPVGESRQLSGRPAWGLGAGASIFFSRYFGLGVEQSIFGRNQGDRRASSADFYYSRWQTSGALMVRYPIDGLNLAPYALVGGGGQYGNSPDLPVRAGPTVRKYTMSGQGFGQLGGGVEIRFSQRWGIFSNLRWMFSEVNGLPDNQMQWRYGVKAVF